MKALLSSRALVKTSSFATDWRGSVIDGWVIADNWSSPSLLP